MNAPKFDDWLSLTKTVKRLAESAKEPLGFKDVKRDSWQGLTPLLAYSLTTSDDAKDFERETLRQAVIEFWIIEESGDRDDICSQDRAMMKALELENFIFKESGEVLKAPKIQDRVAFDTTTMKRDPRTMMSVTYEVFYGNKKG